MSEIWNTKYGSRRVRHDPPTLQEAMAAAQGLTDELSEQIEIAASLMEMPLEQARAEIMKTMAPVKAKTAHITAPGAREGTSRTVVVERRTRRTISKPAA